MFNSRIIILIIFAACFLKISAQSFDWAFQAGGNPGTDWGSSVVNDKNNNVIVTGVHSGTINFGGEILNSTGEFVSKLDSQGNLKWVNSISGSGWGCYATIDSTGNIYVTGNCEVSTFYGTSNNITVNLPSQSAFIAKYDINGNVLWVKTSGDSSYQTHATAIKTDASGNSYVIGYSSKSGSAGYFVSRYDTQGNLLWMESHTQYSYVSPKSVDIDFAGDSYITGFFPNTITFATTTLTANTSGSMFIAKFYKNGGLAWLKKEGTNYDEPQSIKIDATGNIYLTGSYSSPTTFGTTQLNSGTQNERCMFLLKLDSLGNVAWAKSASKKTIGLGLTIDKNNNCLIAGVHGTLAVFGEGSNTITLSTPQQSGDLFAVKYDPNGNLMWAIKPGNSSSGSTRANSISTDENNDCYLTGSFSGNVIFGSTTLSVPFDNTPRAVFITKLINAKIQTGINTKLNKNEGLIIYPNPTSGIITIKTNREFNNGELKIENVLGQLIYSKKVITAGVLNETIDLNKYPKGIYFVQINAGNVSEVRKIVLE